MSSSLVAYVELKFGHEMNTGIHHHSLVVEIILVVRSGQLSSRKYESAQRDFETLMHRNVAAHYMPAYENINGTSSCNRTINSVLPSPDPLSPLGSIWSPLLLLIEELFAFSCVPAQTWHQPLLTLSCAPGQARHQSLLASSESSC